MKVKILIGVICFVVGAGAYYLYENNLSHSSKVEKCADKRFYDFHYLLTKYDYDSLKKDDPQYVQKKKLYESYKDVPEFLKRSYEDKMRKTSAYQSDAEYCEDYAKKYPDIFKKRY